MVTLDRKANAFSNILENKDVDIKSIFFLTLLLLNIVKQNKNIENIVFNDGRYVTTVLIKYMLCNRLRNEIFLLFLNDGFARL